MSERSETDMGQALSQEELKELKDLRLKNKLTLEGPNQPLSDTEKARLAELEARPGGEKPETILGKFNKES